MTYPKKFSSKISDLQQKMQNDSKQNKIYHKYKFLLKIQRNKEKMSAWGLIKQWGQQADSAAAATGNNNCQRWSQNLSSSLFSEHSNALFT